MKNIPIRQITAKQEPDLSESFSIRNITDLLSGKDLVQELHRHDYYFILALKKGKGDHEIDFTQYKIRNNSFFFMHPGQVHQLLLKAGSTGFLLQFNADFYGQKDNASRELLRKAGNKDVCVMESRKAKKLFAALTSIFREYSEKQEGYLEVIRANMGIFLIELVRQRHNKIITPFSKKIYTQERIDELKDLLEVHISKCKQVSQYAEMMNLSVYQLNSVTKDALGKTCSQLIIEQIILESKRYLLATSNQVNQIAYHLGYEDISYFIRFFKKHTGYTPKAFSEKFKISPI